MPEAKTYKHLSAEERAVIMIEHDNGSSVRRIARRLGRSASSVSREIRRNVVPTTSDQVNAPVVRAGYDATQAARRYCERRKRCVRRPR